ncbi:MAG: hypothetical protein DRZ82_02345 [Thermoprotei archaeon]|nr:MAG: hypothetical protein DRZ82_02345 [Thermoprotei archaeon]
MSNDVQARTQIEVIRALANIVRFNILNILNEEGPLNFSNMLNRLGLKKDEAGKFHFHLKKLINAGLVRKDPKSGVYHITELGRDIITSLKKISVEGERTTKIIYDPIGEYPIKLSEEGIREVLVKKVGIPRRIANEVSGVVMKKFDEIGSDVSSIVKLYVAMYQAFNEAGYPEYCDKIFLIAVPCSIMERILENEDMNAYILGGVMFKEYTFSRVIPSEVLRLHINGTIRIYNTYEWPLKVVSIRYPITNFVRNMPLGDKDLSDLLTLICNVLKRNSRLVSGDQIIDHFNYIIAPLISRYNEEHVKMMMRTLLKLIYATFIHNGTQVTLIMDMYPMREVIKVGLGDYEKEALEVMKHVFRILGEERGQWILNGVLVVRLNKDSPSLGIFNDLLTCIKRWGMPIVAHEGEKVNEIVSYSNLALRLTTTAEDKGIVAPIVISDVISINVLKVAMSSHNDNDVFLNELYKYMDLIARTFKLKHSYITKRLRRIVRNVVGVEENFIYIINFVGLIDACSMLFGKTTLREALDLSLRELVFVNNYLKEIGDKYDINIAVSLTSIGDEDVFFSRALRREGVLSACDLDDVNIPLNEVFAIAGRLHTLAKGGHILNILTGEHVPSKSSLRHLLLRFLRSDVQLLSITPDITFCKVCGKVDYGYRYRCRFCSTLGSQIVHYGRRTLRYEVIDEWPLARRMYYLRRYRHILV